jgi:hypothetical protein
MPEEIKDVEAKDAKPTSKTTLALIAAVALLGGLEVTDMATATQQKDAIISEYRSERDSAAVKGGVTVVADKAVVDKAWNPGDNEKYLTIGNTLKLMLVDTVTNQTLFLKHYNVGARYQIVLKAQFFPVPVNPLPVEEPVSELGD